MALARYGEWRGNWSAGSRGGPAKTYGSLPDRGMTVVAFVGHTTETRGMPSFSIKLRSGVIVKNATMPHFVYDPRSRLVTQHAELNRRVGTLKGSSSTGVYANEKSIQLEILAYSSRTEARKVGGLWVGDFTDEHYADLADLIQWLITKGFITDDVYGPDQFTTFHYGTSSPERLSKSRWYKFGGVTGHGAVPGQTHWDTGVLDLVRIMELATEKEEKPPVANQTTKNEAFQHYFDRKLAQKVFTKWTDVSTVIVSETLAVFMGRFEDKILNPAMANLLAQIRSLEVRVDGLEQNTPTGVEAHLTYKE